MSASKPIRLALDMYGGDHGPDVTVAAACDAVRTRADLEILLVGPGKNTRNLISGLDNACRSRLQFVAAQTVLESGVGPVAAIRQGSKCSMGRCLDLVAESQADACVSAGSTTALMALGVRKLGMLNGLKRPALMSHIPSASGFTSLLDLGANLNVDAVQLVQFAIMGTVVCLREGQDKPSVGLLNVGHEDSKGDAIIKEAHAMLKELPINYTGFIEGHDIFAGKADVAVCDGFSGNLILKSGEGLARMFFSHLDTALKAGVLARLGALLGRASLKRTLARFEPSKHNGAPLLGLRGVVVKSHGNANREAMAHAIREAVTEAERQIPRLIESMINEYSIETDL